MGSKFTTMQHYTAAMRMRILRMVDGISHGDPASLAQEAKAQAHKSGVSIGASLETVAEWVRHGCTIYDCGPIQNATTRRVLSDLEDHECNPLATTRSLMAEWAAMRGVTAPDSGCVVFGLTMAGVWVPADARDGTCGAPIARMAQLGARQRPLLEPRHNGQAASITSMTFRWSQPETLQEGTFQINLEGYTIEGAPYHASVGARDDGSFRIANMSGAEMRDVELAAFAIIYGLTLAIGIHSAAITYYTPKRRKGRRRQGRGGKGRTVLRTCKLDTERWACRVRKPGLRLLPNKRKRVEPGHVPVAYTGAGYHVGSFTRGTWIREEHVRDGEEWLDIKQSKRGGLLVKVARECNAEGYMVGTPTPKLVLVQPA
ncbi:hypothetical protein K0U83_00530 [bacterium]|nr:hypothetical protein [bacterium]